MRAGCEVSWPPRHQPPHPTLYELRAKELLLLLGKLGLLVHLPQHFVHHAEQRAAHTQQLIQEHIVM